MMSDEQQKRDTAGRNPNAADDAVPGKKDPCVARGMKRVGQWPRKQLAQLKKKRLWVRILIWLGLFLLALLLCVWLFLGTIVKNAVCIVGTKVTGCPVTLENVSVSLFRGRVEMRNLEIGNPEGFHSPYLMRLGRMELNVAMTTLLKKQIVVEEVLLEGPEITYEKGLFSASNLDTLMRNMNPENTEAEAAKPEEAAEPEAGNKKMEKTAESSEGKAAEDAGTQAAEPAAEAPGKSVMIAHLKVSGGRVHLSLAGVPVLLPLPTVEMHDIGKEKKMTVLQTVKETFSRIGGAIGDSVGKGAKSVGTGVKSGFSTLKSGLKNLVK